jgi:hypothetical protein
VTGVQTCALPISKQRKKINVEEEDIKEWNPLLERGEVTRAYGLACTT